MKPTSQSLLCDRALIEARDANFRRLDALLATERPAQPFFLQGIGGNGTCNPYSEPERWVAEALDSLVGQAERSKDSNVFRPLCIEFGAYGIHFTDRILGAHVYNAHDQWWADYLQNPIGKLRMPDLEIDETWRLARTVAEAFVSHHVTVPLFGMPVIAGSLTLAVSLYGPDFLIAMLEDSAAALHDLKLINDVTRRLHQWYYHHIPFQQLQQVQSFSRCMPPGHISIYGCTTHLVSADLYRDIIAPLDEEVLADSPRGGLIHLCGEHLQHIGAWREMKALRAVQLNDRASEDLEYYVGGLRPDQVIYLNPTKTMTVQRALKIAAGRKIVIVSDLNSSA